MKLFGNIIVACLLAVATGAVVFFATQTRSVAVDESENTSKRIYESADLDRPKPSKDGPHPKLVCDAPTFEFGRMELGTDRSHTFTIRNEGEGDLVLKTGTPTCKCTEFELSTSVVKPGESCEVFLTWEPKSESQDFSQQAPIFTNDPVMHPKQFLLTIEGSVTKIVSMIPEQIWELGDITKAGPNEITGIVHSRFLPDFKLVDLKSNSPLMTVEKSAISAERLAEIDSLAGYELKVTLSDETPVGTFRGEVSYRVEGEGTRDSSVVYSVDVHAHQRGPIEFVPTYGVRYQEDKRYIDIGQFLASEGKTAKMFCFVDQPDDGSDFEVTAVDSSLGFVNVEMKKDAKFKGGNRQRYELIFTIPPGSPPGARNLSESVKILIKTTHPSASEVPLRLGFVGV